MHLAVAILFITADVFIASSILWDVGVSFEQFSLIGDNRILISFPSKESLESFLGLKASLKDYFSSILAWDKGVQSAKQFL